MYWMRRLHARAEQDVAAGDFRDWGELALALSMQGSSRGVGS